MLVLLKLMLPPAFSLPTGIVHWFGDYLPAQASISKQVSNIVRPESARAPVPEESTLPAEIKQIHPRRANPEPAAPAAPAFSGLQALTWQAAVFVFWLMGAAVLSVLLIHRILFVRRLIAQSEPARDRFSAQSEPARDRFSEILDQCRQQLGIKRKTELRLSGNLQSPAVCGLFRPVILIPAGLIERLSPDKLKTVLIHELAHIKRGDLWVNCIQTILQIIYFYNPFVWLANAVVRRTREQAVDEMVLVALGSGAKNYSNTLIDIAEMAFFRTSLSLRLTGVVESKKALYSRIRQMLNRPIPKSSKLGVLNAIVIIIIAAVLLPMAKAEKLVNTDVQDEAGLVQAVNSPLEQKQNVGLTKAEDVQKMIDSAQPGATVIVPKGLYTNPVRISKSLTLKGASQSDCVFEVTENEPAVFIDTKSKGQVTVENLTLKT
jgi:beta-lactamase regulating signal transducer with metallopeptidase domain